jgi:hypothetical protein
MTDPIEKLPMLIIDGAGFCDFEGFTREFSRLLDHDTWRGNLDAFNDILHGGFGTPENGWILRWLDSETSRTALGHEATRQWLERDLLTCYPSRRSNIEAKLREERTGSTADRSSGQRSRMSWSCSESPPTR